VHPMIVCALLAVAGGAGSALAWWRGYGAGYVAAMSYRKTAEVVEATTFLVNDETEDPAA
jgi:hypothetical protein